MKKFLVNILQGLLTSIVVTIFICIGFLYIAFMAIKHPKDTYNGLIGLKK